MEPLQAAARVLQPVEEAIPRPVRTAFEQTGQGIEAGTEAAAGGGSVGLRAATGDPDAIRRQGELIREHGVVEGMRRSYQEESIPFVTGAIQAAVDPRNLALGGEPAVARGILGAGLRAERAAGTAALRAADVAAERMIAPRLPPTVTLRPNEAGVFERAPVEDLGLTTTRRPAFALASSEPHLSIGVCQ